MIDVVMPQMGESLAEGTVVRWLKAVGDRVGRDEPLVEISTDKVDTEVPSPVAGTLKQTLVAEGQTVAVGVTLAAIETDEEAAAGSVTHQPASAAAEVPATAAPPAAPASGGDAGHFKTAHAPQLVSFRRGDRGATDPGRSDEAPDAGRARGARPGWTGLAGANRQRPSAGDRTHLFSPAVLATARDAGIGADELTSIAGSGRGGRLTRRDLDAYLATRGAGSGGRAPAPAARLHPAPEAGDGVVPARYLYHPAEGDQVVPMSTVRQRIADHMVWSTRISPHASAFAECDMQRAADVLARGKEAFARRVGAPLTYTALAAYATAQTLREFPVLNASVVDDLIVLKPAVHLGVAVALADTDELIVPVIRGADGLSLEGMARALEDRATRARERRLKPEDVQGGTFTLTNPGVFGGLGGTPILNQPQVAILGLGAIVKRPVVVNEAIAIRPMMMVTLTFDHRATDGMQAFRFLGALCSRLSTLPQMEG
jgi:2-oxoglutarate dehydrogenase E2 component (dihydrolipoamide succinyltransferase)